MSASVGPQSGRAIAPGRLTRRAEFVRMTQEAVKIPMPGLVLQARARGDELPTRLGFTVTKKVGNAVIRNRARRRLREAARLHLRARAAEGQALTGADLVLVGRAGTLDRPFDRLIADVARAIDKAWPKARP